MTQAQNASPGAPAKPSRRERLEQFVAAHPADAFARYGLAIECANQGDSAAALANFETLLVGHPEYVTGYFQYAQLLARLGRAEEARKTLSDGIVVARRTGDHHAADEMQAALAELMP